MAIWCTMFFICPQKKIWQKGHPFLPSVSKKWPSGIVSHYTWGAQVPHHVVPTSVLEQLIDRLLVILVIFSQGTANNLSIESRRLEEALMAQSTCHDYICPYFDSELQRPLEQEGMKCPSPPHVLWQKMFLLPRPQPPVEVCKRCLESLCIRMIHPLFEITTGKWEPRGWERAATAFWHIIWGWLSVRVWLSTLDAK